MSDYLPIGVLSFSCLIFSGFLVGGRWTHVVGCPDFFCSVRFWWLVLYIAVVSSVSNCCVDSRVWCADYLSSLVDSGPGLVSMRVYLMCCADCGRLVFIFS